MTRVRAWAPLIAFAVAVACVIAAFWESPMYSPDSWAYFELSESLRSGGYTLNVLRSYGPLGATSPSAAFPPLWPLAWRLFVALTGLGPRAGLVLTGLVVVLFAVCSEAIGRKLTGCRWAGITAACLLLVTPGYSIDIVSAGTIPPQLLLVGLALLGWLRRDVLASRDGILLGALAGAMVMLRYDMAPFALVLGAGVAWLSRSRAVAASFAVACLVVLLPWIVVSQLYHGVWFASDNTGIALSIDPNHYLTDWHPPGQAPPSAFERPAAFAWKLVRHTAELTLFATRDIWSYGGPVIAAWLVVIGAAAFPHRRTRLSVRDVLSLPARLSPPARVLAVFTVAALAMVPLYVVTGYYDRRYFSLVFWLAGLWVVAAVARRWPARFERAALPAGGLMVAAMLAVRAPEGLRRAEPAFPALPGGDALRACLLNRDVAPPGSRVLFVSEGDAARASAVHGVPTAATPRNFWRIPRPARWTRLFLRVNGIAVVSGAPEDIAKLFPGLRFDTVAAECGVPLFRLRGDRPPSRPSPPATAGTGTPAPR